MTTVMFDIVNFVMKVQQNTWKTRKNRPKTLISLRKFCQTCTKSEWCQLVSWTKFDHQFLIKKHVQFWSILYLLKTKYFQIRYLLNSQNRCVRHRTHPLIYENVAVCVTKAIVSTPNFAMFFSMKNHSKKVNKYMMTLMFDIVKFVKKLQKIHEKM